MTPNFVEYNNTDILMDSLALTVTEELKKFLDEKELVTLSLPGGSTPKPLFDRLFKVENMVTLNRSDYA